MTTRARSKNRAQTRPASEPPISENEYHAEILRARDRIGETTDGLIAWFVRFARTDLNTLSAGQWMDLRYEVACLSEYQYQSRHADFLWQHAITLKDWHGRWRYKNDEKLSLALLQRIQTGERQPQNDLADPGRVLIKQAAEATEVLPWTPVELPPREIVQALQHQVCEHVSKLTEGESLALCLPPVYLSISPIPETDETLVFGIAESPHALFAYNEAFMFALNAVRVRRCTECQQPFYADRKNKSYCSVLCQSRAGTKRWRGSAAKRKGQRGRSPKAKAKQARRGRKGSKQ